MSKFNCLCVSDTPATLYSNVLNNRKLTEKQIEELLNADEEQIHDYHLLNNINEAIEILHKAVEEEKVITLVVDCDVDGMTSTGILYQFLQDIYPKYEEKVHVLFHEGKQHGFSYDLEIPKDTDLMLMADAGTNDVEQQRKFLDEKIGREIIILDHHPKADDIELLEEVCIVNPQLDDYPNKFLSGAGVVYKFIEAYGEKYRIIYDIYKDLAGLGNLADVMDSRSIETRAFFNYITDYDNIYNKYLKTMIDNNKYEDLSLKFLAWNVVPQLNAVMRIGTQEQKKEVFYALVSRDDEVIAKGIKTAKSCKSKQDRDKKKIVALCEELIEKENLNEYGIIMVNTTDIKGETNLNGLVAQIISEEYNKPTLVYSMVNGEFVGSGRNNNSKMIKSFRDWCNDTGLFSLAQGHDNAFGVKLSIENEKRLRELIAKEWHNFDNGERTIFVDGIIDYSKLDYNEALKIASLEPLWATSLREPTFFIRNVNCNTRDITRKGSRNNVLSFNIGTFSFFKNFLSKDFYNDITLGYGESSEDIDVCVDFLVKFKLNTYNGITKPQLEIVDAITRPVKQIVTKADLDNLDLADVW